LLKGKSRYSFLERNFCWVLVQTSIVIFLWSRQALEQRYFAQHWERHPGKVSNVTKNFEFLIEKSLRPWIPLTDLPEPIISSRIFDFMERRFYGMGVRVRLCRNRLYFRNIYPYKQPFYYSRLRFHLNIIRDAMERFHIEDTEFFLNLSDGPRAAIDTSAPISGFPIFAHVTSDAHIDILIPDPMEYGAYGKYYVDAVPISWGQKRARLFFRGGSTNFDMAAGNWHLSPRIRAAKISSAASDDSIDLGISHWSHVQDSSVQNPNTTCYISTAEDVEKDTGLQLASKTALEEQCSNKWLLLLDGGWGGSRRAGILRCGSVLVQQESPWRAFYSNLLEEKKDYVQVDRHLHDLKTVKDWLTANDKEAETIAYNGKMFADNYLTYDVAVQYWGMLLNR
jgi:hypothetical protein